MINNNYLLPNALGSKFPWGALFGSKLPAEKEFGLKLAPPDPDELPDDPEPPDEPDPVWLAPEPNPPGLKLPALPLPVPPGWNDPVP